MQRLLTQTIPALPFPLLETAASCAVRYLSLGGRTLHSSSSAARALFPNATSLLPSTSSTRTSAFRRDHSLRGLHNHSTTMQLQQRSSVATQRPHHAVLAPVASLHGASSALHSRSSAALHSAHAPPAWGSSSSGLMGTSFAAAPLQHVSG